jgi:hypothetical protein
MNKLKLALVSTVLTGSLLGAVSEASAIAGPTYSAGDAYGALVTVPGGKAPSSTSIYNTFTFDTNGYNVTVRGYVKDTGRSDGQLAGLYATLYYMDGTNSGRKLIGETGNETSFVYEARAFVPSKRVKGIALEACRRSTTSVNACGTPVPGYGLMWDNPYT